MKRHTLMQGVGVREVLSLTDLFPDQTGYTWQVTLTLIIRLFLSPGSA